MIPTNYRVLLQQAFAFGNTSPQNDMFARPKNKIKRTRKRKITRDKSGNLIVHATTTISAVATRSSKCDTTMQAALASLYGRVVGAVEQARPTHRDVMHYIYNPLCSSGAAYRAFWHIVLAINDYVVGLTQRQNARVCAVVPMLIRDQLQSYRGYKLYAMSDIYNAMGVKRQNYGPNWERHVLVIRAIIDRIEHQASRSVRTLVTDIHTEPLTATMR